MAEVVASGLGQRLSADIRALRLERGMSLGELGEVLGVGAPAISNMETRGVLRLSTLEQLAWALEVDLVVELRRRG